MNTPVTDVKIQGYSLKKELLAAIKRVLESGVYIRGPEVKSFEKEFANHLNVKNVIAVGSGTDALYLSLLACNIGPGDEVITTSFSFIAAAEAILRVGATPIFVDIYPDSYNIDIECIIKAITSKTKAILPVHLFGNPANIDIIYNICLGYNLFLIEDCAQACGASINDKFVGTFGDVGCFSFFPSKNLGCMGDGGAIITNDSDLANKVRSLSSHGKGNKKYHHINIGINSRLDEVQAAILRIKLKYLDMHNEYRKELSKHYTNNLINIKTPDNNKGKHIYNQYCIQSSNRDEIKKALLSFNIESQIYYPIPLHKQPVFNLPFHYHLPVAEIVVEEILALPMYPGLELSTVYNICHIVNKIGGLSN